MHDSSSVERICVQQPCSNAERLVQTTAPDSFSTSGSSNLLPVKKEARYFAAGATNPSTEPSNQVQRY